MRMDKLELVLQKIEQQNFKPRIKSKIVNGSCWREIEWTKDSNEVCFIYETNVAIEENKIAWFQSSDQDNHLLTVYDNDVLFSWIPKTYNPVFGCNCMLIEWYM